MKKYKVIFTIIILFIVCLAISLFIFAIFVPKPIMNNFFIKIEDITSIKIQRGMSDDVTIVSDKKAINEIASHLNSVKIKYLEKNDTLGFSVNLSFYKDKRLLKSFCIINPKMISSEKITYETIDSEVDLRVIEKYIK